MLPNQISNKQLTQYYQAKGAGYWQIGLVNAAYDELDPALRIPMDDMIFRTIRYVLENGAREKQINIDLLAQSGYTGEEAFSIRKYVTKNHDLTEQFTYENDQMVHDMGSYVRKIDMTKELFDVCTKLRNLNKFSH